MATFEFKLPDLGEGVMEGEIVKWCVKVGDVIAEDTTIVEVMTDKATVTVPTPKGGTVLKLYGAEGELARVHQKLADLEVADIGGAVATTLGQPPVAIAAPVLAEVRVPAPDTHQKVLATPVTRRMAAEHHLDLAQVAGTGPQGRVLKSDVEALLASATSNPGAAPVRAGWQPLTVGSVDQRVPLRGLRKKIAEKMVKSKFTAPHYAFVEEVDATALITLRNTLNTRLAVEGVKLSFLPFFVKAVVAALRAFPQINATMDEATGELIVRGDRHIGIAAMTEHGLTVPVLRHADRQTLRGLGSEITRLAAAAREQRLKLDEVSGGSFTITSLGQSGGLFATPIINHPEVAIMGVHRMRKRAVVTDDDRIVVRPIMLFSFSFDHRVIDGATGAEFAYEVIRFVEQPELLLVDS
jgi:pyruvate dehydrogenase E2 component (dihydrolipoamide acetyltransferase)